jgi:hypothetical protein
MQLTFADNVKETTTTVGTGTYSVGGAVTGFQTFVAGIASGNYCPYAVKDAANWEEGIGLVTAGTPDTVSRFYISGSSNGGAAVNWGAGTKTIQCSHTAFMADYLAAHYSSGDPNGFVNAATDWTFAYSAGTRTLTLTPVGATAVFWSSGLKYTKTSAQTTTHPDTEGLQYFYFDESGVLQNTMTFSTDLILKWAICAIGYWDATNNLMIPDIQYEMHGKDFPSALHLYLHLEQGSSYDKGRPGITPTVVLGDGSSDTHIEVATTIGYFWDEDLAHTVAATNVGDNKVKIYRSGATGVWRMDATTPAIVRTTGSGRAAWNEYTGGAWQDTEVNDGEYMIVYDYVCNLATPLHAFVAGQATYTTIESAQAASVVKPDLGTLPGYEFLLVAAYIVQSQTSYTNTYNARIVAVPSGSGFWDWRTIAPSGGNALTSNSLTQFADTTSAQLASIITDETGNGSLVFAGQPTIDSPILTSALSGTAAGQFGRDALAAYYYHIANARGVLQAVQGAWIQADFTLAAASGVQNCLTSANDTLTVNGSTTYRFKGKYIISNGTTSHTTALAFALAGGASVTSFEYTANIWSAAANTIATSQSTTHVSGVASKVLNAASTNAYTIIEFEGVARINAGGTIAPQIAFSANPTGTNLMKVGSYIEFWPIGTNAVAACGQWA